MKQRIKKFWDEHKLAIGLSAGWATITIATALVVRKYSENETVVAGTHMVGENVDEIVLHLKNGSTFTVPGRPL